MLPSALVPSLRTLLDAVIRWDHAARELEAHGLAATLPRSVRQAMRRELQALHRELSAVRERGESLVERVEHFFAGREPAAARARCARRARAVLRAYETLCERPLPFSIAALLLRHHDLLRRACEESWPGPVVWHPHRHHRAPRGHGESTRSSL